MTQMNIRLLTETESQTLENTLVIAKQEGFGGGMEWEVGVSRYKLLHIKMDKHQIHSA